MNKKPKPRRNKRSKRAGNCQFDACCPLNPPKGVSNMKYCPEHQCKRKNANALNLVVEAELFETPREFRVHSVETAKEGTRIIIVNDTQHPFQDKPTLAAVER
ncbi:hypothetical protein LCGC14_1781070, partial [marine sediment metagenome]